ncbi:hypothetical protein BMS3Abin02_02180 [bacterium BMS3Abin02]|nr:hypothetical protein BMS3Abin02_02180 [bacterium BMS3Abin02]HDL49992.1 hypothetical protein [Actinomycetota bacterium]
MLEAITIRMTVMIVLAGAGLVVGAAAHSRRAGPRSNNGGLRCSRAPAMGSSTRLVMASATMWVDNNNAGDRFVDADDGIRDNACSQQRLGDRMGNHGH